MDLTEIYARGVEFFKTKDYGRLLDYVETGFIEGHDRRIIDRYTFVQQCLDAPVIAQRQVPAPFLHRPVILGEHFVHRAGVTRPSAVEFAHKTR